MQQHFIIEGKYLGSAPRSFNLATGQPPLSYGFFCWKCGGVYATAPIDDRPWQYWSRTCRKCGGGWSQGVPGSILLSWDPEFFAAFPEPVLRWEFARHLDFFDRTQNG